MTDRHLIAIPLTYEERTVLVRMCNRYARKMQRCSDERARDYLHLSEALMRQPIEMQRTPT